MSASNANREARAIEDKIIPLPNGPRQIPVDSPAFQLRITRRQITCLKKRVTQLSKIASPEAATVIRRAKLLVRDGGHWNRIQLSRAVKAFERRKT